MPVKIAVPAPLRPYTGQQKTVEIEAPTAGILLARLVALFPDLKAHLYDEHERIRRFVNVYVNDEDIRYLENENTPVHSGDLVSLIPSVSGG
jgi:molybdopterin converting factor small subunit